MDFQTLSRRQLQALCKRNRIPANLTNLAMANALNALQFVEGIEEILNPSESDIAESPMVPPTGGRSRAGVMETPATRRRAAAASTSVRRKIDDEIEEEKSVKTPAVVPASRRKVVRETSTVKPVYSTRRSTRLAAKIEGPKEVSEAIKISSFAEEIDEDVEVKMEESQTSEISALDTSKECSEESEVKSNDDSEALSEVTSDNTNGGDEPVAVIEQKSDDDIKADINQEEDEPVNGLMKVPEEVCALETEGSIEDTKISFSGYQETEAFIEDAETNANAYSEVNASFEDTDVISYLNEEGSSEKDTEMKSDGDGEPKAEGSVEKDTEMTSDVEELKASFEDSEMKNNVDEEPKAEDTEMKAEGSVMKTNVDDKAEETEMKTDVADFEGHMIGNVILAAKEKPSEKESCQEEMFVPEVELDGKDNHESPMNKFAGATPKSGGRLIQISDDKENVVEKKPLEDHSLRQLIKEIKRLEISKKQKKEVGNEEKGTATATRPALKTLSDNMMVVEDCI